MFGAMHARGKFGGYKSLRARFNPEGEGGFKNNIQLKKNVLNSVYYHKGTHI